MQTGNDPAHGPPREQSREPARESAQEPPAPESAAHEPARQSASESAAEAGKVAGAAGGQGIGKGSAADAQRDPGNVLYAPWRMDYIRSLQKPPGGDGCFLCQAAAASDDAQRRQRLVLWHTPHCVVLINRFPYTNGHLLIAPAAHKADPEELGDDEKLDLMRQTTEAVRLLKRAVSAQGFNLGVNLGRCAGAGVPGHLHQHVVPRWAGDVNFMHVVGETHIVPEATSQLYKELMRVRAEMQATGVT